MFCRQRRLESLETWCDCSPQQYAVRYFEQPFSYWTNHPSCLVKYFSLVDSCSGKVTLSESKCCTLSKEHNHNSLVAQIIDYEAQHEYDQQSVCLVCSQVCWNSYLCCRSRSIALNPLHEPQGFVMPVLWLAKSQLNWVRQTCIIVSWANVICIIQRLSMMVTVELRQTFTVHPGQAHNWLRRYKDFMTVTWRIINAMLTCDKYSLLQCSRAACYQVWLWKRF